MLQEVTDHNVLSVKFSSVRTVINAMKWSCCLDTQLSKSLIAYHLIYYPL